MNIQKINTIGNIGLRMQKMLVAFFDELIAQFPDKSDFVAMRVLISSEQTPMSVVFESWLKNFEEDKKKIKNRDPDFFLNENGTFSNLGKITVVETFKDVWKIIEKDEDNKNTIWKWIDGFVLIVESYKKATAT